MAKKSKKRRNFILLLIVLLGAGGWFGWKKYQEREKPITVQTEKIERRDITESVVATGNIHPVTRVVILVDPTAHQLFDLFHRHVNPAPTGWVTKALQTATATYIAVVAPPH